MGVAALLPAGGAGRRDYRSRTGATIIVFAVHVGVLLLLVVSLSRIVEPQLPTVPPMVARLIVEPAGQQQVLARPALSPHFVKPSASLADAPPNVRVDFPVEVPPSPQVSDVSASLPSGRKNAEGDGSPNADSDGVGQGKGPRILHQVAPTYSAASVKAHEQGTVTLRVLVDAQGAPSQISIAGSSGFPRLDQSAAEAAQHYRFSPSAGDAQTHRSWTTVEVEFDLLRMPVPTSIVAFDSAIAQQVSAAARSNSQLNPEILKTDEMVRRLAGNLFDTLSRRHAYESALQNAYSAPTPIQVLAKQGKLKWVRFMGFASRGFDCGTSNLSFDFGTARCEIFEVRQDAGTSYWLSLIGNNGTALENVSITTDASLLHQRKVSP
jgi:protein TonB